MAYRGGVGVDGVAMESIGKRRDHWKSSRGGAIYVRKGK